MEKKQIKFLITGIVLVVLFGLVLILSFSFKKQSPEIDNTGKTSNTEPKQIQKVHTSNDVPKCSDNSLTTASKNNKIIRVSDHKTNFSFKVPNAWLIETRHSGEKQLTTEEMREFLATNFDGDLKNNPKLYGDYLDITWDDLKKMTPEEVVSAYKKNDAWHPFPNASVSASDRIWYNDTSWKQIDFYVIYDFDSKKTLFNDTFAMKNFSPEGRWCIDTIGGVAADVVTFPTDKDENGNEIISKGGSGGKIYFLKLNDGKDMLVINKQAKGDRQFEDDFLNLIQNLKFSN